MENLNELEPINLCSKVYIYIYIYIKESSPLLTSHYNWKMEASGASPHCGEIHDTQNHKGEY